MKQSCKTATPRQYAYIAEATIIDHDQVEVKAANIHVARTIARRLFEQNNPGAEIEDISVSRV